MSTTTYVHMYKRLVPVVVNNTYVHIVLSRGRALQFANCQFQLETCAPIL